MALEAFFGWLPSFPDNERTLMQTEDPVLVESSYYTGILHESRQLNQMLNTATGGLIFKFYDANRKSINNTSGADVAGWPGGDTGRLITLYLLDR